jgi:hypothetical protein
MIRFCPKCATERSLAEMLCDGTLDGRPCGWDLSQEPPRQPGWRPARAPAAEPILAPTGLCPNGHSVEPGDLLCGQCGADLVEGASLSIASGAQQAAETGGAAIPSIPGWRTEHRIESDSQVLERFAAVRDEDGQRAILTVYSEGHEPDAEVYEVLRTLDREHVPDLLDTGHWDGRAYELSEDLRGGTLADVGLLPDDLATLSRIVSEIGSALHALSEHGLRHRDLRPSAILIRTREPLDLVVTGFGSARLSDFDLDVVSPLETTRYTAPEAVAGGVAAASDWWSLGILLLEQVTRGDCFEGVNDQAFLIHVLTHGAPIPEGLTPEVDLLLRGLLTRDRRERWGWSEAQRWLAGESPSVSASTRPAAEAAGTRTLALGGAVYASPAAFALAAAEAAHWDEARALLVRGAVATWAEEAGFEDRLQAELRQLARVEELADDLRLTLALKALNPAMPLVSRGEIVTPGWLLDHPDEGYSLIAGPAPNLLARKDAEVWLSRLQARALRVRERAEQLGIALDEAELRLHLLATSRSRLGAVWRERSRLFPDTDHPGLVTLMERRQTTEEDYIILLAADIGQFRTADAVVADAAQVAADAGVERFDATAAHTWLEKPRRELYLEIEKRLASFSRCDHARIDEWADSFRVERRLPLPRTLALLAVPADSWREPPRQAYVANLLDFFGKRITNALVRGPLTRMLVGKNAARLDLTELDSERRPAAALLDHLLRRKAPAIDLDPAVFQNDPTLERRLRTLHSHATLYRRDTGIDGLYLGFPFLLLQENRASVKPRIAPVLLWPVQLRPETGARARIDLAFDVDRQEVRLNPAFNLLLGTEAARRWEEAARDLLGRESLSAGGVLDAFAGLAAVEGRSLVPLPGKDVRVVRGADRLVCAAVLFNLSFLGQAVLEDLRHLKSMPPAGTGLEKAFRVGERGERSCLEPVRELDRYVTTDSDPSQDQAVLEARAGNGLVVEGPPGTGKSQTIVNMVADAIGRRKSLLVVCQKQAALEVVHKRLEAAGLGGRVMMLNDVNKDRLATIRAVREQLEALAARPAGETGWRQQRRQLAARIEALEADLDRHHEALYAEDPATGLSYRLVLGDLIAAETGVRPPIDVPRLRSLLASVGTADVSKLQEICGPIASLWLPSEYEDSQLAVLRPFASDAGTVATFAEDLATFAKRDRERCDVLARTAEAIEVDDPDACRRWEASHAETFRALDDEARERLARWLPRLTKGRDEEWHRETAELAAIAQGVATLTTGPSDAPSARVARGLSTPGLGTIHKLTEAALPAGFLPRLSPSRFLKRWKLRNYLYSAGLADPLALRAAVLDEIAVRPFRDRLAATRSRLGEPPLALEECPPAVLAATARTLREWLAEAEQLTARLLEHPRREAALAMAGASTREAVDRFLDRLEQGLDRHRAQRASLEALAQLAIWFEEPWLADRRREIGSGVGWRDDTAAFLPHRVAAYQRFRPRARELSSLELKAFRALRTIAPALRQLPADELDGEVRSIFIRESRLAWKARLENQRPALLFEPAELAAKREALAAADREMRTLNRRWVAEEIDMAKVRPFREWEDITRLAGQRTRRLREFLDRGTKLGLMALRPVWLMNPDVASRVLPLRGGLFDAVIYDEASQMPIEYAVPSLYRSRVMIVSGDEKQMPPSAFFSSRVANDEGEAFEGDGVEDETSEQEREELAATWDRREIKDCPDLLQLARSVLPATTLQIHYRSAYRELIQFSNASFYANRLSVPARHPEAEVRRVRPIELLQVDGIYEAQTNRAEAERVVAVVAELWKAPAAERKSVGVVTFNRKQADLIEERLEALAEKEPELCSALAQERDRVENGEDVGFFVKNVENVQGDERDVIVFSSTFGRNAQGTFRRSFGVLGQAGGERRLNVAVTRAREKVILVTSMPIPLISDLLAITRQAESPRDYLQAYFEYARALSAGELERARSLLGRLASSREQRGPRTPTATELDGFQRAVEEEIKRLGFHPQPVQEAGVFDFDFAIEDPRTGLFGIAIECDAPRDRLLDRARPREVWRPGVLRRSIPAVHRVSSLGWCQEPAEEKARLRAAIEAALRGEVA